MRESRRCAHPHFAHTTQAACCCWTEGGPPLARGVCQPGWLLLLLLQALLGAGSHTHKYIHTSRLLTKKLLVCDYLANLLGDWVRHCCRERRCQAGRLSSRLSTGADHVPVLRVFPAPCFRWSVQISGF